MSIGFVDLGLTDLPDWYMDFYGTDNGVTSTAFEYRKDDYILTVYFTPIGVIGQYCEDDESRSYLAYFKLANQIDLIDCFENYFDMRINQSSQP